MSNKFESKDPVSDDIYNSLKWERIHTSDIKFGTVEFVEPINLSEEGIEGISFYIKGTSGQIDIINISIDDKVEGLYEGLLLKIERAVVPAN